MFFLPIPQSYVERIIHSDCSNTDLQLIIDLLPNQAFAALSTIASIGSENICFPERSMSSREMQTIFWEKFNDIQLQNVTVKNYFLEKGCHLFHFLQKGLDILILTFPKDIFISVNEYEKNFFFVSSHSNKKELAVSPFLKTSITSDSAINQSTFQPSVFTCETPVTPTQEQIIILDAIQNAADSEVIKTQAFAGTGKTTLCCFIAQTLKKKMVYLAFNKTMVEFGRRKLKPYGDHITCSTIDALAYRCVEPEKRWGISRTQRDMRYDLHIIADRLGLQQGTGHTRRTTLAGQVLATVSNYCYSADRDVSSSHIPPGPWSMGIESLILNWASNLFNMIIAAHETLPIRPEHIMKFWDLTEGILPTEFEIILLDEAQDINNVFISIVKRSARQCILIGDNHQQLYRWRGADNALSNIDGKGYDLTHSFRFGDDLANLANSILAMKTNKPARLIIGNPGISTRVIPYSSSNSKIEWPVSVILARTNVQVFNQASKIASKGHRLNIIGGLKEIKWLLLDALNLYNNQLERITNPVIRRYRNWNDLVIDQETTFNSELYRIRRLVEENHKTLITQIDKISQCHEDDERRAPIILSTTHKVKGREWERVMLLDDFAESETMHKLDPQRKDEEINTLYVAATRAVRELYIPEVYV